MNCSKAHEYFVKHVDNNISPMETEWLDKHLMKCEKCREDFIAYEAIVNAILEENANADNNLAPSDLETAIMEQISELSLAKKDDAADKDNIGLLITFAISFAITVMMSLAIMMGQNVIAQMQSAIQRSFMTRFGGVLEGIRLSMDSFLASIYSASATLDMLFDRVYFGVLLIVIALVFIQLTLWRRGRATQ